MRSNDLYDRRHPTPRLAPPFLSHVHLPDGEHTGITGGFGGDRRVEYIIPPSARKAGTHAFVIESSCNGMFGVPWNGDTIAPPDVRPYSLHLSRSTLALIREFRR